MRSCFESLISNTEFTPWQSGMFISIEALINEIEFLTILRMYLYFLGVILVIVTLEQLGGLGQTGNMFISIKLRSQKNRFKSEIMV